MADEIFESQLDYYEREWNEMKWASKKKELKKENINWNEKKESVACGYINRETERARVQIRTSNGIDPFFVYFFKSRCCVFYISNEKK